LQEIFFGPDLDTNITLFTHSTILQADQADQTKLFQNIVLSGGNTMYKGFVERFNLEMCNLCGEGNFKVIAPEDRITSVWRGGSLWASGTENIGNYFEKRKEEKDKDHWWYEKYHDMNVK